MSRLSAAIIMLVSVTGCAERTWRPVTSNRTSEHSSPARIDGPIANFSNGKLVVAASFANAFRDEARFIYVDLLEGRISSISRVLHRPRVAFRRGLVPGDPDQLVLLWQPASEDEQLRMLRTWHAPARPAGDYYDVAASHVEFLPARRRGRFVHVRGFRGDEDGTWAWDIERNRSAFFPDGDLTTPGNLVRLRTTPLSPRPNARGHVEP